MEQTAQEMLQSCLAVHLQEEDYTLSDEEGTDEEGTEKQEGDGAEKDDGEGTSGPPSKKAKTETD